MVVMSWVDFERISQAKILGTWNLHELSRDIELDFLVDQAMGTEGVLGARMMGGGFGGCTINLIEKPVSDHFVRRALNVYRQEFGIDAELIRGRLTGATEAI